MTQCSLTTVGTCGNTDILNVSYMLRWPENEYSTSYATFWNMSLIAFTNISVLHWYFFYSKDYRHGTLWLSSVIRPCNSHLLSESLFATAFISQRRFFSCDPSEINTCKKCNCWQIASKFGVLSHSNHAPVLLRPASLLDPQRGNVYTLFWSLLSGLKSDWTNREPVEGRGQFHLNSQSLSQKENLNKAEDCESCAFFLQLFKQIPTLVPLQSEQSADKLFCYSLDSYVCPAGQ